MAILNVQQLAKRYGPIQALKGISFEVPQGSVFGVLGPNGSGKTTLLGIVMSVLRPSGGGYQWFNNTPTDSQRKQIGTLLETPNFYHYLSAVENLKIAAAIKGRGEDDIDHVLEVVNLAHRKHSPFSSYSLGMKQRLAIGAALLGNPGVLVLDEPTNGLDPVGIAEIRDLIKALAVQGKTIIMASHLLDEVEKVCTHVAILKQGDLVVSGNVNEIFMHEDVVELAAENLDVLDKVLNQVAGFTRKIRQGAGIELFYPRNTANLAHINAACFSKGVTLSHLQLKKKNLESKFIELTN